MRKVYCKNLGSLADAIVVVVGRVDQSAIVQLNLIRSKEPRLEAFLVVVELDDTAWCPCVSSSGTLDARADGEA